MNQLISIVGLLAILLLGWLASTDRKAIRWRPILAGLGIQFALALFILKLPGGQALFQWLGARITALLDFSKQGSSFVFGKLVDVPGFAFIFAFQVLPTIVFMAALIAILYYLGIVQAIVQILAWVVSRTLGTSAAESLSAAACVFVGQVEGPLLVRPYIGTMTRSELMALMTGGMSTIAGGVMAAYLGLLGKDWAPSLLAASLMGAPAGLVMAKLMVPETGEPRTRGKVELAVERHESSVIEAAAKGAIDGMHLAFNVGAMLLAFISLLALVNAAIGWLPGHLDTWFGWHLPVVSLQMLFGAAFSPLAFLMGVPWSEAVTVGGLIGQKLALNEFVAYADLVELIRRGELSERSIRLATFALCGFANFSSIAQNVGGIGAMAPERRGDLAQLGLRAMVAGALASCLSAAMAGMLLP
ncbi:MAG: NupC/NupG family nucleoside CNT transporter [bacterium]|nr:NupC/NupG family nucleoside CNT transporter [bacterium]